MVEVQKEIALKNAVVHHVGTAHANVRLQTNMHTNAHTLTFSTLNSLNLEAGGLTVSINFKVVLLAAVVNRGAF